MGSRTAWKADRASTTGMGIVLPLLRQFIEVLNANNRFK